MFIKQSMIVMKFGGSSLESGGKILHVAEIIRKFRRHDDILVVVSAMYKVTDKLISVFNKYKENEFEEGDYELRLLYELHMQVLKELQLPKNIFQNLEESLYDLYKTLQDNLKQRRTLSQVDYEYIITYGERFSSHLVAAALNKYENSARAINASEIIILKDLSNPIVLVKETTCNADKLVVPLIRKKIVPIVTGFFASTKNGTIISLGRGGSDYSATLLAYIFDATQVILWKEVNGVYCSDPHVNQNAKLYSQLSYEDALLLSKKGAKILHPEAMIPVSLKGIPVWVKNTFNPDFIGTKICKDS